MFGLAALLGALVSVATGRAPASSPEELAQMLGEAAELDVRVEDVRWEPSAGALDDAVFGRRALFLGATTRGAARDVLRARVRVTPEGRPFQVASVANLTQTPLGDDHALVVSGARAAFATRAFGQVQSVTVLALDGEGAQNATEKAADRAMAFVTNVQATGDGRGVGRLDVALERPTRAVGLVLRDDALDVALDEGAVPRRVVLKTKTLELEGAPEGLRAQAGRHLPKRLVFWAVDTVRAVPWIGPAPIAWLEDRAFEVKDTFRRLSYKAFGGKGGEGELVDPAAVAAAPQAPPRAIGGALDDDGVAWPPPAIPSIFKKTEPGEGEWAPPKTAFVKRLEGPKGAEVPPAFLRTFVSPDEERPYAKVQLVAMDMRQLDLGMEAGVEDPKPLSGPPGTGRIPRDPKTLRRVAAAWNGGFKTEHGTYGMMVNRRVLLPPVPGAATVATLDDGRVLVGSWGLAKEFGGVVGVADAELRSVRQNLPPLLDGDKVNPSGNAQWGFTLPGTGAQTERSGMCVRADGTLIYAWGDDLNAIALGKAMKMAGCTYGMHLDMNPHHTGFVYTDITEIKGRKYRSELMTTQMTIQPERFVEYSPKDFFFVTVRDVGERLRRAEAQGADDGEPDAAPGVAWEVDPGAQPAPAWLPSVTRGTVAGLAVTRLDTRRLAFRARAGTSEPDLRSGAAFEHELRDDDAKRVVLTVDLGASTAKAPRGLVTSRKVALPTSDAPHAAVLGVDEGGALAVRASADGLVDAVELPRALEAKRIVGGKRRARAILALGEGEAFVVAAADEVAVEDLAKAALGLGARDAVVLERGQDAHAGRVLRAGTPEPPRATSAGTQLFALATTAAPRVTRLVPVAPVPPPAPKRP